MTLNAGNLNSGSVTLNSTSTLGIGLGGTIRSSQYGDVVASGNASLAGTLNISVFNGFTPAAGNRFDILDWGTHSGTFASVTLPTLSGSLVWNTSLLYTSGVLRVVDPNFLPGDMNLDHHVDAADILPMEQALTNLSGYKATYVPGITDSHLALIDDVDGDGIFTNADLQTLLNDLNSGGGSADLGARAGKLDPGVPGTRDGLRNSFLCEIRQITTLFLRQRSRAGNSSV